MHGIFGEPPSNEEPWVAVAGGGSKQYNGRNENAVAENHPHKPIDGNTNLGVNLENPQAKSTPISTPKGRLIAHHSVHTNKWVLLSFDIENPRGILWNFADFRGTDYR